ncbi:copper transporter 1A isoform X2 [Megalopta genalis]|uniref:copper transporter 1A isoform X2 n=2 Tax=Megalopta genalis TaxID=115081 RepID=UPI001443330F|nr:high affinity copper uptake protein 1-like isoform X1 [Megalopta genalis]
MQMSHDHMPHMMNASALHSSHDAHAHGGMHDHSSMAHDHMNHSASTAETCVSSGMHMMTFHGGYCENVLFQSWKISSIGGLVGSMIGIMIMAALYEGLKYYREYLFWKTYNALQYRRVTMPVEKNVVAEDNRVVHTVGEVIHKQPPTMLSWMHTFQTFLHIVQIVLSYFLMLIFMTYNVWLGFAVVFGAAIGYFLFGWKKSVIVDVTEHCH